MRTTAPLLSIAGLLLACGALFSQTPDNASNRMRFGFADVRVSPKASGAFGQFMRIDPPRNGRYEIHSASMVDLIQTAFGFEPDKILGGPSWLEMDRFDIAAKVPDGASPDNLKLMLQSLLEERFGLRTHKDSKPLPTYALTAGKNPKLKPADGSGDTGCRMQSMAGPPGQGGVRIALNGTQLVLGPGAQIQFVCRNMTMEAFAAGLRGMVGAAVGTNAVLDETGLKGAWNFDVRWSLQMFGGRGGDTGEHISIFDALEKQLGLKLEPRQVATPVLLVDAASEKPIPDPPGTAEALPEIPAATAFEVADVKPSDPDSSRGRMRMQPGGRLTAQGMPMRILLIRAFNVTNADEIVNVPAWADAGHFDITAKAPAGVTNLDIFTVGPMLQSLLKERFKLKTHTEERPQNAYTLVAAKPKMKKADPASRTSCRQAGGPPGSPRGTIVMTCRNITMDQFAEQLRNTAQELQWPILNATEIAGGWDFALTYNQLAGVNFGGGRGGEAGPAPETGMAPDPEDGLSIFEAVEKQLGLKLEMRKRPEPVIVIDHLEEKPTDN